VRRVKIVRGLISVPVLGHAGLGIEHGIEKAYHVGKLVGAVNYLGGVNPSLMLIGPAASMAIAVVPANRNARVCLHIAMLIAPPTNRLGATL
jgi:hypothetical protein